MSARNTPNMQNRLNKSSLSIGSAAPKPKDTPNRQPAATARHLPPTAHKSSIELRSHKHLTTSETDSSALNTGFANNKRSTSKLPFHSTSATPKSAHRTPESLSRAAAQTPTPTARHRTPALLRSNTVDELPSSKRDTDAAGWRANSTASAVEATAGNGSSEFSTLAVAVRVRPLNARELRLAGVSNVITVCDDNRLTVRHQPTADGASMVNHSFQFDRAFWCCNEEHANFADQRAVFEGTALPLIDKALEGYNACLFAYGQTGSGKSYSMMGIDEGE